MVNIATGKAAHEETSEYLVGTLQRGALMRHEFQKECSEDDCIFLKRLQRVKVSNFAFENIKSKSFRNKADLSVAEGVRDAFGHLLVKAAMTDDFIDLQHILSYPVTKIPLSLAHVDGTPTKTDKAVLVKILHSKQTHQYEDATPSSAVVVDDGLILHEVLPHHINSTYGKIVRDIMIKVCASKEKTIHLLLDRYVQPSIKDVERVKRGANVDKIKFIISGPDQQQKMKGTELLKHGTFKEGLSQLLMSEIQKEHYASVIANKTVYVSHGGNCVRLSNDANNVLVVDKPEEFQGSHEEADTLIAFHAHKISGTVKVRSSDTDVLIVLIGLAPMITPTSKIMVDFGTANHRKLINVTDISEQLEKTRAGLSEALLGFHALTGCDFTSSFYRKGKNIPFTYLEKNPKHILSLRSLCSQSVDQTGVTEYVCQLYGFKALSSINEARYQCFLKMTGGKRMDKGVRKINCASLPPCKRALEKHILRANLVSIIWRLAYTPEPSKGLDPIKFGWEEDDNGHYVPFWYEGSPLPGNFPCTKDSVLDLDESDTTTLDFDEPEPDGEQWSDDSSDATDED